MTNPVRDEEAIVVKFTETVSTLALLNLYWLVSALLIFPVFAATEALFYCVNRHAETRETGFGRIFYTYVKENLLESLKRQGLPILILIIAVLDTFVVYTLPTGSVMRSLMLGGFLILSILIFFLFMYQLVFLFTPDSKVTPLKRRVGQSFYAVVRYPQYSFSLLLVLVLSLLIGLYFVPMLIFFGLSFPAYCFTFVTFNRLTRKSHRMD